MRQVINAIGPDRSCKSSPLALSGGEGVKSDIGNKGPAGKWRPRQHATASSYAVGVLHGEDLRAQGNARETATATP